MSNVNPLMPASNNTIQPVSSVASVKEISNFTVENAIPQPKNEKDNSIQTQGSKPSFTKNQSSKEELDQVKTTKRDYSSGIKASLSLNSLISIQETLSNPESLSISADRVAKKYELYQKSE